MDDDVISINELDLDMISPNSEKSLSGDGSTIVVIGKRGTGKSFLIKSLLYNKSAYIPVGIVFSGTEESNHFYTNFVPKEFVYTTLNTEALTDYTKRQKKTWEHMKNPWSLCLIDDCMDDPKHFKTPLFQDIFKNGRHWKTMFILSLQYCLDISPNIRTNIDGVFILRETNLKNRKKIWENYAGIIPDFELFTELMNSLTENYTALYIHNKGTSNNWQELVFWYKAKATPDDFKFGCVDYWQFAKERGVSVRK